MERITEMYIKEDNFMGFNGSGGRITERGR